jgi:hypothetical protein
MIVECHSGYEYPEYPQVVVEEGTRTEVTRVAAEWISEDGEKYFQVILADGRTLELIYTPHQGQWTAVEVVKV